MRISPPFSRPSGRSRSGFTLVELLATIGVVIILFALLMGIVGAVTKKGETSRTRQMMAEVDQLLSEFQQERGYLPAKLHNIAVAPRAPNAIAPGTETLAEFIENDAKRRERKYDSYTSTVSGTFTVMGGPRRGYDGKFFQDVWGADLYYILKVKSNKAYTLGSYGPDSYPGTMNYDDDNDGTKDNAPDATTGFSKEFGFGDDISNENTN